MAWSYDPTDLGTTTASGRLNTVRLLVGDTDTLDQQVQNEEVVFGLSQVNDDVYYASAWVARVISGKYSRRVDTSIDGALSSKYSDLATQYSVLADRLEFQGKKSGGALGVTAGGISKSRIEAVRSDTDRVEGSFRRDRFHNPPGYKDTEYE